MVIKTDFLGYIVSDKETAYPDGAVQDGYYYEKVGGGGISPEMSGCTKIAVDTFIPASTYGAITVNHSLGEIPKVVLVFSTDRNYFAGGYAPNGITDTLPLGHLYNYSYSANGAAGINNLSKNSLRVNITSSGSWVVGITYTVITMA